MSQDEEATKAVPRDPRIGLLASACRSTGARRGRTAVPAGRGPQAGLGLGERWALQHPPAVLLFCSLTFGVFPLTCGRLGPDLARSNVVWSQTRKRYQGKRDSHRLQSSSPAGGWVLVDSCQRSLSVLSNAVNCQSQDRSERCCGQRRPPNAKPFTLPTLDLHLVAGSGARCFHPRLQQFFVAN